ncbi:MAG: hypothetical protein R6W99_06780 [Clostridia bacterium]
MKRKRRKKTLYLSDKQPLTFAGKIGVLLLYVVLASWAIAIIWPLYQMIVSAFRCGAPLPSRPARWRR